MLELDTGRAVGERVESNIDPARARGALWVVTEITIEVPRQREVVRRIPVNDEPETLGAIVADSNHRPPTLGSMIAATIGTGPM